MTDAYQTAGRWKTRSLQDDERPFHEDRVVEAIFGDYLADYGEASKQKAVRQWADAWGKPGDVARVVMDMREEAKPAGMAWGRTMRTLGLEHMRRRGLKPDDIEIAMAVAEDSRGRGAGSVLLPHTMVQYREAGVDKVYLHVLDSNEPAKRLYANKGFEPVKDTYNNLICQAGTLMVADLATAPID
jgi:ribosomal protein S18 acetylase RimI-like enzyme